MKKTILYLLLLFPAFAFGQLFPEVGDFRGKVRRITERRYGKELNTYKNDSGVFRPKAFSGWEYIYEFDENYRLVKRTNTVNGAIDAAYTYEWEESANRQIEREIIQDNNNQSKGDYIEYENLLNAEGKVEKVNYWAYKARDNKRELFVVEKDARYEQGKLVSYTRHAVKEDGELDAGELCSLIYDASGKLIRMERKDIIAGFKTILYYHYNRRGRISQYTIDYMVGLRDDQNTQKQNIYYKYDRRGNWTRRYWLADNKRRLEDKRKIKYQ